MNSAHAGAAKNTKHVTERLANHTFFPAKQPGSVRVATRHWVMPNL